jgi:hypothetical protein
MLPRAYRRAGFFTDICDATNLATCRMYRSGSAVWNGLAKNAREGMASAGQIGFWTLVLVCGQVLPVIATDDLLLASFAVYAPRCFGTFRFRQDPKFIILHPLGILLLLAIQWYAIIRVVIGKPIGWKGRSHPKQTA